MASAPTGSGLFGRAPEKLRQVNARIGRGVHYGGSELKHVQMRVEAKMRVYLAGLAVAILLTPAAGLADEVGMSFGGDQYTAGQIVSIKAPVEHDAFAAGRDVSLSAPVSGNAHLAGFNVDAKAAVTGNLYAAGYSVTISGPVGGSLSAAGNTVSLESQAATGGNVRLAGASVAMAAPIQGSALVSARTLTLDGTIAHDLSFYGETMSFGPGAKVNGMLLIQAPKPIDVPASVASSDRVKFTQIGNPDYVSQAGNTAGNVLSGFWPALWAAAIWWLLLLIVGIGFIAAAPRVVAAMATSSATRPFRNFGLGIVGFAAVLGLVPVAAITLVGILLLPFVALFIAVACSLAYLAGVYFVGLRIMSAFASIDSNAKRVAVLAAALVAAGLLGLIPVLGWLISLVLLMFGMGVALVCILDRRVPRGRAEPVAPQLAPGAPASS